VSSLLPHEETALRVFNAFSIHRRQVLDDFWDESEFIQIRLEPTVETWSPPTQLLRSLWRYIPFGRHLAPEDYDDVINNLHLLKEQAREQLFYWYTAGPLATNLQGSPVDSLTLFIESERFWFQHIAPIQQYLKDQIHQGRRIRYLERFHLDYDRIELSFNEIRISQIQFGTLPPIIQAPYRLVICPGREHTFRWPTNFWETGLENPDSNLVNPTEYRLPPTSQFPFFEQPTAVRLPSTADLPVPNSDAITTRRPTTERINPDESDEDDYRRSRNLPTPPALRRNSQIRVFIPPVEPLANRIATSTNSDANSDSRWNSTNTTVDDIKFPACWCSTDVCYCSHRPETPPTPPGITLWSPSDRHLPDNRI
jgi:hypothetical protein